MAQNSGMLDRTQKKKMASTKKEDDQKIEKKKKPIKSIANNNVFFYLKKILYSLLVVAGFNARSGSATWTIILPAHFFFNQQTQTHAHTAAKQKKSPRYG